MRQIRDGLSKPFENAKADLIKQNGKCYRKNKACDQAHSAHRQRIAQCQKELRIAEQRLKVIEAHPFLFKKAACGLVLLERHRPAP
ncbi:hypothetical protein D3C81_1619280 [compost metagenome]